MDIVLNGYCLVICLIAIDFFIFIYKYWHIAILSVILEFHTNMWPVENISYMPVCQTNF